MVTALPSGALDTSAPLGKAPVANAVPEYGAFGMPLPFHQVQPLAFKLLHGPLGKELR